MKIFLLLEHIFISKFNLLDKCLLLLHDTWLFAWMLQKALKLSLGELRMNCSADICYFTCLTTPKMRWRL